MGDNSKELYFLNKKAYLDIKMKQIGGGSDATLKVIKLEPPKLPVTVSPTVNALEAP